MAEDSRKPSKLTAKDVTGLKYFDQIAPLLQRLHDDACDRDTAGNRTLHYDQYCMLMLLCCFNPIVPIAVIFAYRWAIEIFFRFFKHMLGCRHLLSHKQNGIEIQTYSAIIACMLIALWTGRKPTKRTFEMICFYFCGLASEEELMAHIEKLKKQTS